MAGLSLNAEQQRLIAIGKQYGFYVYGSGTVEQLYGARDFGKQIEARLQAVGGNTGWSLQELEYAEKSDAVPQMPDISVNNITNNSASVNWFAGTQYTNKPQITSFHFVLKDEDTGQTITETDFMSGQQNSYESNLDSGTNYKGYLIAVNAIGNSSENSIGFKTTGIKVEPEPEPITISPQVQTILTKFDNNDYEYPYTDLQALINSVKDGSLSNENFLTTINNLLQSKTITDKTIIITYCVNVYTLDSGGNVLSDHYDKINLLNLQNLLSENKYVFYCKDGIIPTEQQVRDFYGYTAPVADSSINTTMVSQLIGTFILKDGRVKGQIMYITNEAQYNNNNKLISGFNPFYYSKTKNLTSLVQIKSKSGVPIAVKPNGLNFTQIEKDEIIHIDEAVGNFKEIIIDFFVWKNTTDMRAFAENKQIQVVETPPDEPEPCEIGFHKDFSGKCVPDDPLPEIPRDKLIDTLKGFLFGTVALSLLARKY